MGHIRIGKLPKRRNWLQVCELLETGASIPRLSNQISKNVMRTILNEGNQTAVFHCLKFLIRLTYASKSNDFINELTSIGVNVSQGDSGTKLLSKIINKLSEIVAESPTRSHLDTIAVYSLNETLTQTILKESNTLFGCSIEDVKNVFKKYSTRVRFGKLSRLFFSNYLNRIFQSLIDRTISDYVGTDKQFKDVNNVIKFQESLGIYCWEVSKIVEDYSGGWFSKHAWEGTINDEEIKRYVRYSFKKLLTELKEGK